MPKERVCDNCGSYSPVLMKLPLYLRVAKLVFVRYEYHCGDCLEKHVARMKGDTGK